MNKRQAKKKEKKSLQAKAIKQGQDPKKVKKQTQKQHKTSISQTEKKQKRKLQRDVTYKKKTDYLLSQNIPLEGLTKTQINSIKIKDIESGNVTPNNYSFLAGRLFDYNTIHKLKGDKRLYFAYRDFSQNRSFEEILKDYESMSNTKLYEKFCHIAELKPTYTKRKTGKDNVSSSGSAGDFKFLYSKQENIEKFNNQTRKENRKPPKKVKAHGGDYSGYQVLKSHGRVSIDEVTPRKLMEVGCAMMYNITEWDRVAFYKNYYSMIKKEIPEFAERLPKPLN